MPPKKAEPNNQRNRYSAEELDKIKSTLQDALGDQGGSLAAQNLDERFVASEVAQAEEAAAAAAAAADDPNPKSGVKESLIDVAMVLKNGKLLEILKALAEVEDPKEIRQLVAAVLKHGDTKSFHLVEALKKVKEDKELVNALVHSMTSRKGVNPLIESLKYALISPDAMKSLALSISDQGTVNHVLRAVASAPTDQPDCEIIWCMEVIGKGNIEQMLDGLKLIDSKSPGMVILATGIVNRGEAKVESMVRALGNAQDNPQAAAILVTRLCGMVDVPSLVSLLEKYVQDTSEAGEIVAARLAQKCANQKGRAKLLASACRFVKKDTMTGRILASGLAKKTNVDQIERGYRNLSACPSGRGIVGLELIRIKGKFGALRVMGKVMLDIQKKQSEYLTARKEAEARAKALVQKNFPEDAEESPAAASEEGKAADK
ncbi:MAG: hypothetical protein HQL53_04975 [Magnetococcales bacterium]|nr:hypothetical protein [Magnetococcales bacterium]